MTQEIAILSITAASIGFFHTIFGPDHYLPFIVMAKSRQWSYLKTSIITIICGLGHVLSSVILGLFGIMLGVAVAKLELVESVRGEWAAWALISFGLMYTVYGIHQAVVNKPHTHFHVHSDGSAHAHEHKHHKEHAHLHDEHILAKPVPWALFVIFVLGPCEPLIPILMYPAVTHSFAGMVIVASIFSVVTIATMLGMVLIGVFGLNIVPFKKMERYSHALAGFFILMCGCAMQFLGL